MKLTNNMGLPSPFVRFVERRQRRPDPSRLSVTALIGPAWQRMLLVNHWDELEADASESVWSLFGTAVHDLLEKYADPAEHIVEEPIRISCGDDYVIGHPDLLSTQDGILTDYKVTSVWSLVLGGRVGRWAATGTFDGKWAQQLNLYAHGMRQKGHVVSRVQNIVFLRDWSAGKALAGGDYPGSMVVVVPQPLWSEAECDKFLRDRLQAHAAPTPCSPEERWVRPSTWAVMKEGRKTAVRVFDNPLEAEVLAAQASKQTVVERRGRAVRCESYCSVRAVCRYAPAASPEAVEADADG
jgi:hypothetical protein